MWTLQNEDRYLAWDFEQDVHNAFDFYLSQEVDGMFTDFPQSLVKHLDLVYKQDMSVSAARRSADSLYWTSVVVAVLLTVIVSRSLGTLVYINDQRRT